MRGSVRRVISEVEKEKMLGPSSGFSPSLAYFYLFLKERSRAGEPRTLHTQTHTHTHTHG